MMAGKKKVSAKKASPKKIAGAGFGNKPIMKKRAKRKTSVS
jgi:hypothetical protein